jgi:SAM-dependent methyltransferase
MTDQGKVIAFYEEGAEDDRFARGVGRLEFARTQELLRRSLPAAPARIADVGGGPGRYAQWLASEGYDVALVDPVPRHVEAALARAREQPFSALVGDARSLPFPDESFDAVLLLGPLYHLLEAEERGAAWREAVRVARSGGLVVAAAIARFAALLDGIRSGWISDAEDLERVLARTAAGPYPEAMGSAFLHRPDELQAEATAAGLRTIQVIAVEGPFWLLSDLDRRAADTSQWELLLASIEAIESEPLLLAASNHLLAVGRKA